MLDLAIIGGGPAGLAAGLYATRGGLKSVVMFEMGMPGGQITSSSEMENYPGVAAVMDGMSFMAPWQEQCFRFGLKHEMVKVEQISKDSDENFTIFLEGGKTQRAKAVIVATGSTPRRAGVKGEDEFFGRGISTCATCDGFFYKNKEVAVLGGGNTALEEAIYLSNICSKVYLIHRRDEFRAAPVTVQKVKENEKIAWVNYPRLKDSSEYALAQKYLPNGVCGVISFGIKGGRDAAVKFMDSLKLAAIVVHVADARTSVLHPASTTHRQLTDAQLVDAGISPDLIRMSVGIENVNDIIADIEQALNEVK